MEWKSVHDMTPAELRAEVQRLRRESKRDAEQSLVEYERVRWTCPECGDEGGPGDCRECMINGPVFNLRVPGAELIVRRLAERKDCFCPTDPCDAECIVARARLYVSGDARAEGEK